MYHSIGQQLMHQDPVYYLWYMLTRSNHAWKLISYLYYIKYAKPGDKTGFHHINVNVPDAITTGRGINIIQGFLTLTAEEPGDCTEILPEMHNYLENWWGLVKEQDLSTNGYVHHIKNTIYTKDDKRKFGIKWNNPMMIEELDTLFGPEEKKAQNFINNWYLKATQIALDAIIKTY
ncbi:uncharacterized protein CIMG_13391 [Coccidioides immitis RS]|uniref:Uncharacterized protein n=1 Tax=Coccidioides immitis (strain RS) TaxID=246410 RepID=A0A0D8JUR6_COCIM|nr:uncharacterized protein CIMG_13391 [Coccidioides immitis RS]KJF61047.1 hypothetical protein CIMG_13391 [Coccidioides immitis RS]